MNSIREHRVCSAILVTGLLLVALAAVFAGFWDGHVVRGLCVGAVCTLAAWVESAYTRRFLAKWPS